MRGVLGTKSGLLAVAMVALVHQSASAQVPIVEAGTPVTQNFDTLAKTGGTFDVLPAGWFFLETGESADTKYGVSPGTAATGDTYSFGANNATDRAFGTLTSSKVASNIGARFTNSTGAPITSLAVSYMGEWWRAGGAAVDSIVFEYSTNATALGNGTWVAVGALAFSNTDVSGNGGAVDSARDGNLAANRSLRSATIGGLSIANGASFWFRWVDTNPPGSDHALAIDDFSLTANASVVAAGDPVVELLKDVSVVSGAAVPGAALEYSFLVSVENASEQGIKGFVLTDALPTTVAAIIDPLDPGFTFTIETDSVTNLTAAVDGDAGEIVNGVVTVRIATMPVGGVALITFRAEIAPTTSAFKLSNVGTATYDGATAGTGFELDSNEALINVVACVGAADCNDENACTNDACTSGSCVITNNTLACDDGLATTHSDVCGGGNCGGTAVVCAAPSQCQDAGVPNGTATCVPTSKPNTAVCNDGNANTVNDLCDGNGNCVGTSSECPTNPVCNQYTFNGTTCVLSPVAGACDDGFMTTRGDTCVAGACQGTTYTCTAGQCDASSVPNGVDCTVTPKSPGASCNDANPCTEDDICGNGQCAGVTFCGAGELCDAGQCDATHCTSCDDSVQCGRDSACLDLRGSMVCLLVCASDDDCAVNQVCRDFEGERRCFDTEGTCAAPAVDPDVNPEPGPESVEPSPEVTEPSPEADVSEPDVTEPSPEVSEPDTSPEVTETEADESPEVTETEADESPEVTETEPDESPEMTETDPDESPEVTENVTPETSPEQVAEVTPDATPEATADTAPEGIIVEPTPDAGAETKEKVEGGCTGGASTSLIGLALLGLALARRRLV